MLQWGHGDTDHNFNMRERLASGQSVWAFIGSCDCCQWILGPSPHTSLPSVIINFSYLWDILDWVSVGSSESLGPHLPPAAQTSPPHQGWNEQSVLTITVPDLDLAASSHPRVLSQHLLWSVCYQGISHATAPHTLCVLATAASMQFPLWILIPQTSWRLQMLLPLSGYPFFDTSFGKLFFAFGAHLNWHSPGRGPWSPRESQDLLFYALSQQLGFFFHCMHHDWYLNIHCVILWLIWLCPTQQMGSFQNRVYKVIQWVLRK